MHNDTFLYSTNWSQAANGSTFGHLTTGDFPTVIQGSCGFDFMCSEVCQCAQ